MDLHKNVMDVQGWIGERRDGSTETVVMFLHKIVMDKQMMFLQKSVMFLHKIRHHSTPTHITSALFDKWDVPVQDSPVPS